MRKAKVSPLDSPAFEMGGRNRAVWANLEKLKDVRNLTHNLIERNILDKHKVSALLFMVTLEKAMAEGEKLLESVDKEYEELTGRKLK